MIPESLHAVVAWSNRNEGFVTLVGCLLGIPSIIYTGWNIRIYIIQKKKDEEKERRDKAEQARALEQAQWRGIYRIPNAISYHASGLHAHSLRHSRAAQTLAASGEDVNAGYKEAGTALVAAIGGLLMELTLIPQCAETLALVEFFSITYRSADSRAAAEFTRDLQRINAMVLVKAGGKPLDLPQEWKGKSSLGS